MIRKKTKIAAVALTVAAALTLSGTFAWQSISQMALNEAREPTNPGGRLHDDFSGYGPEDTKDIYVENFGNEPIYARVRLDEYMELGEGAGLKGTAAAPNPDNHATPLVAGTDINDVTTWVTHTPGSTIAGGDDNSTDGSTDPFHTYWTWTMGGQAEDNTEGKTVYMPTFNKNKDSLKADINGTMAGLDKDPAAGDPYDDHKSYTVGESASRVRDNETDANTGNLVYDDGAAYDADADTTDECGPYGGAGGTGAADVNYTMVAEEHKAQETMGASVITMAEYRGKTDAQKAEFKGWVYDKDGWAYWSQPIEPGTPTETDEFVTNATGLLLDRIVQKQKPSQEWYYGINAVGQFITADDLGRIDDPKTGFYTDDNEKPSKEALDLLEDIGVNTAAVRGSVAPAATYTITESGEIKHMTYAVQGMDIDLSAAVAVAGETSPDTTVTWTLSGNSNKTDTKIETIADKTVLHVAADETGTLKLVAESNTYDRLKGKITLPVQRRSFVVTVTADDEATSVLPGGTQGFTAVLSRNDFQAVDASAQAFTWTLDAGDREAAYKSGTTVVADTDTSKATLTVAGNETGTITVKATPTDTTTYPDASGTAPIPVTAVTYTVAFQDGDGNPVSTDAPVGVAIGGSTHFSVAVTTTPAGASVTDNWSWTSSDSKVATINTVSRAVTGTSEVTINVADNVSEGSTATITATNNDYDPALTASFTARAQMPTYTLGIKDKDGAAVTGNAKVEVGSKADFALDIVSNPAGCTPGGTWKWVSATTKAATVAAKSNPAQATVTIPPNATVGNTSVITVTNSLDPTLTTTFTVEVGEYNWTVKRVDNIDFYVLVENGEITGTDGKQHSAALLLSKDILGNMAFSSTMIDDVNGYYDTMWKNSDIRNYLNSEDATYSDPTFDEGTKGWLAAHPDINARAVEVSIETRTAPNQATSDGGVNNKVFLLSEADVFGSVHHDINSEETVTPETWEYTYGGLLECFKIKSNRIAMIDGTATASKWCLRSPMFEPNGVASVTASGTAQMSTASLSRSCGVRPAFWYHLDSCSCHSSTP